MTDSTLGATPREPFRRFSDPDGGDWLVWRIGEDVVGHLREAPSVETAWLIFLGPEGETRRLAPVPRQWRRMQDAELHALALAASPWRIDPH